MQDRFDFISDLIDDAVICDDLETIKRKLMFISYNIAMLSTELQITTARNKEKMM